MFRRLRPLLLAAALLTSAAPVGQSPVLTSSTTWVVPAGVFSVSIIAIGRGDTAPSTIETGSGGSLRYVNNLAVTPGDVLTVTVNSSYSRVVRNGVVVCQAAAGGASLANQVGIGFNGGAGRTKATGQSAKGGGAGGYTSAGQSATSGDEYRGGGGADPYGRRLTGALAGVAPPGPYNNRGQGENFGGGGGLFYDSSDGSTQVGGGAAGCVRIIYGPGRAFPNTLTEDM